MKNGFLLTLHSRDFLLCASLSYAVQGLLFLNARFSITHYRLINCWGYSSIEHLFRVVKHLFRRFRRRAPSSGGARSPHPPGGAGARQRANWSKPVPFCPVLDYTPQGNFPLPLKLVRSLRSHKITVLFSFRAASLLPLSLLLFFHYVNILFAYLSAVLYFAFSCSYQLITKVFRINAH